MLLIWKLVSRISYFNHFKSNVLLPLLDILHDHICLERVRCGRAFVRPSGTEDIVRVYAEGESQDEANAVAEAVARHVYNHANGGVCPT